MYTRRIFFSWKLQQPPLPPQSNQNPDVFDTIGGPSGGAPQVIREEGSDYHAVVYGVTSTAWPVIEGAQKDLTR